ncbi:MAG: SMC family ATPase [Chloroflexi bacterium]|nr:SMC family ATPase [Chloroflexota bacterium]
MIPLRLSLRNFMCYREGVPTLDLEGVHVACLCGDNGHGKSALLEAMTWALWGKSRAASDDDLIHYSQGEMEVEIEFLEGKERYRVLRKRARGRRPGQPGQSLLELQVAHNGGFRSIAGNSLRETQQILLEILRLDYDTFINSAFLLQGRADEFTHRPPAQRKDILSNILGLGFYDRLEAMAKDHLKLREAEEEALKREIESLSRELALKANYEAELQEAQALLEAVESRRQVQERNVDNLRRSAMELEIKGQELGQLDGERTQKEAECRSWESQAHRHLQQMQEYQGILSQAQEVETGYRELVSLRQANDELGHKLHTLLSLRERHASLQAAVERIRSDLATQERLAQAELDKLEAQVSGLEVAQKELKEIAKHLEALYRQEEGLKAKRQQASGLALQIQSLQSRGDKARDEISDLQGKLDMLKPEEALCPLCQRPLSKEDRARLQALFHDEILGQERSLKEAEEAILEKGRELMALKEEVENGEVRLKQETARAQARDASLKKDVAQAVAAREATEAHRPLLEAMRARLGSQDFAHQERQELQRLGQEMAELGYDEAQHLQAQRRIRELTPYEAHLMRLREAEKLIPQEEAALAQARSLAEALDSSLRALAQRIEELRQELQGLPQASAQLRQAEATFKETSSQKEAADRRLGAAQQKLERCLALEGMLASKERELHLVSREKDIYEELALAFSHRGVPALIIESALPEVEAEANQLLTRMTGGRMFLTLEAQRPRRAGKGEPIETLDILIADELGTRNYEMFSGGEAFRINLALRIALSRLLARRARAPLPILIIDEGFGTQDSAGRDSIVEAITSIQDDFEKVLVITHIEELKEAFPVRIEVTKTESGSTFTVT